MGPLLEALLMAAGFSTQAGYVEARVASSCSCQMTALVDPDDLISRDVVVAGGPGSALQAKTLIGSIERSTTIDGQLVFLLGP